MILSRFQQIRAVPGSAPWDWSHTPSTASSRS
jgi:hypothetical protein